MDTKTRKEKLKEIRAGNPCAIKDIYYRNCNQSMKVFEIPLEYLIFNQYNGRIATFVKTYERQHGEIDASTPEGEKLIEDFLWKSQVTRNKATEKDLKNKGQLECGIVTSDGVVIDGNRRFMLLKRQNKPTNYFKAIILEDSLGSNKKEIMRLETMYQMGVDDKVDYNPIQKYLKCRDLIKEGFSEEDAAEMMGEKPSEIKTYLGRLELMDDYLDVHGYAGLYRILDEQQLEWQFADLYGYLSKYKGEGRPVQDLDWIPRSIDISNLKSIYFDYIRAGFGVHDIRIIGNPAKNKGFFTKTDIWGDFYKNHSAKIDEVAKQEESFDDWREKHPRMENIVDLARARDTKFSKAVKDSMKANLGVSTSALEDRNQQDAPLKLLEKAEKTLNTINTDVEAFRCDEVREISRSIRKTAEYFIKVVDGKA